MKKLTMLLGMLILLWGTGAPAAENLLTEKQLDGITAGTSGENAQQSLHDNSVANYVESSSTNDIHSDNPDAVSVVNIPNTSVDNSVDASQNVNSKNMKQEFKDNMQKNAKAVSITNALESQVGAGVNVHVNGSLPGGSSGGSLNSLYQSNTIINNK